MKKSSILGLLPAMLLGFGTAIVTAQDEEADTDSSPPEVALPQGGAQESEEDDVFIPSEEVQAAEELAFPVDI